MTPTIERLGVSMQEVAERMQFSGGSLVLDVRSRAEFLRGHVPGALNAPISEVERSPRALVREIESYDRVFVHCSSGVRSSRAFRLLRAAGAENVKLVDRAGFSDWCRHGHPVERGPGRRVRLVDPRPRTRALGAGIGIGLIATLAAGAADAGLSLLVSQRHKRRERRIRRGSPHQMAGTLFFERIWGRKPSAFEQLVATVAFNVAYGVVWGAAYTVLRRLEPSSQSAPALPVTAAGFFVACDGAIAPLLDLSPGVSKLPWQFNAKELANHIVWNATAERLHRADERRFAQERLERAQRS